MALRNNTICTLCDHLHIADAWRYYHPDVKEFTWSNKLLTSKSRIDFFYSQQVLPYVLDVSHQYAPFSDHLVIKLNLQTINRKNTLRGYWKLNNTVLKDKIFNNQIKSLANEIFSKNEFDSHGAN